MIRGRGIRTNVDDGQVRRRSLGRGRGQVASTISFTSLPSLPDFVQAYSTNLPGMSFVKVAEYFQSLQSPELRQAKDER